MKAIVALLTLVSATTTVLGFTYKNDPTWSTFKTRFLKRYETVDEEIRRYKIFLENMQLASHYNDIDKEAVYGMTQFSDKLPSELFFETSDFGDDNSGSEIEPAPEVEGLGGNVPESYDWRTRGGVTGIKNQRQCGSCWAFAAVGCAEGAYFVKTKNLISLSEQELVDCDSTNKGCNGGQAKKALEWAKKKGGFMNETSYPYTAVKGTCVFDSSKALVKIKNVYSVSSKKPAKMQDAIVMYGPLAVSLDAAKFNSYISGIMDGSGCSSSSHNHAVLVVGWGVDATTSTKYWIIKNSWGSYWGESGYVRLVRGSNACAVEKNPFAAVAA